jgi:hypothetical protein
MIVQENTINHSRSWSENQTIWLIISRVIMNKCPFAFEYKLNATKIQQGKQHNSVVESHTLIKTRIQNYVYKTSHIIIHSPSIHKLKMLLKLLKIT